MPTPVWEVVGDGWVRAADHDGTRVDRGALALAAGLAGGSCAALLEGTPGVERVVASLGIDPLPAGARVRLRVRARVTRAMRMGTLDGRGWTPWAPLGVYGAGGDARSEVGEDPAQIEVDVDTVKLPRAADALEARLELTAAGGASPRVRRLALLAWRTGEEAGDRLGARGPAWGKELAVPERSQQALPVALRPRCCSPTSLSMVLAFHGKELPTEEVCRGVHDEGAKLYGNWSFNVAYAGRLGLRAVVGRCTSMADLDAELAAGRPVVLSHRYGAGEVQGAAVNGTDGHLIVARGITADGDVVVNDPAADPSKGQPVRRVYRRADLARSWLGNGSGICYLVGPEA